MQLEDRSRAFGGRRRSLGLATAMACAVLGVVPAASSAGIVPSKTAVAPSIDVITATGQPNQAVLTATVTPGLLVTPTGTVTFTDMTNGTPLGSAPVTGPCLLSFTRCTAKKPVLASQLAPGQNAIKATYSGDVLLAGSSGTGFVYTPVKPAAPPDSFAQSDEVTCAALNTCVVEDTSDDGTADLRVFSQNPSSASPMTVLLAFQTQPLGCSVAGTGDVGVYNVSDQNAIAYVTITRLDTASQPNVAEKAQAAHPITNGDGNGTGGYVCWQQTKPFTTASGAAATRQADGTYQGALPQCTGGTFGITASPNAPCVDDSNYDPGNYRVDIQAQGDPRMG